MFSLFCFLFFCNVGPVLVPAFVQRLPFSPVTSYLSVQFSPVPWIYWVVEGDIREDSAKILFQSFSQEAIVSSSGTDRDVHSLMLSIQHFLCRQRRRSPFRCPEGCFGATIMALVTYPNHASFRLLTVARSFCGPTRKLILLRIQLLVLCSK